FLEPVLSNDILTLLAVLLPTKHKGAKWGIGRNQSPIRAQPSTHASPRHSPLRRAGPPHAPPCLAPPGHTKPPRAPPPTPCRALPAPPPLAMPSPALSCPASPCPASPRHVYFIANKPYPRPAEYLESGLPSPNPTCSPRRCSRFVTSINANWSAS